MQPKLFLGITTRDSGEALDAEFRLDLLATLGDESKVYVEAMENDRGADLSSIPSILIALGSAGAFSAVYQVVVSYLGRNKERELVLEIGGNKLTVKGHSLPEEKELLSILTEGKKTPQE
jgi:hypothetical protein